MYKGVYMSNGKRIITYTKMTRIKLSGGKYDISGTDYTNIHAVVINNPVRRRFDENGNIKENYINCVLPKYFFTVSGFTPDLDDFIKIDGLNYRIINITDYTSYKNSAVYYVTLRRDEIDS